MKFYLSKIILFGLPLILGIYLLMSNLQLMAQETQATQSDQKTAPMSPAEVDSYLAGMSDEQVRQAYAQKLKQDAQKQSALAQASQREPPSNKVFDSFHGAAQSIKAVLKRIENLYTGKNIGPDQWEDTGAKLSGGKGAPYLFGTVMGLAAIITLGLVLRWLFRRTISDVQENLLKAVRLGKLQFFGRVLSHALLEAMGIGVYVLATFMIFVTFYEQGRPSYVIVFTYLIVSYYIFAFAFGARIVFSPEAAALRLFPMEDRIASFLYQWILRITLIAGFFAGTGYIFDVLGVSRSSTATRRAARSRR